MNELYLEKSKEFIREITSKDSKVLTNISISLLKYIFKEEIPSWFKQTLSENEFIKRIENKEFKHYGYVIDNEIVGYIAIQNESHLYHLFVDEKYHKKGISKKLWNFILENTTSKSITTNASIYAVSIYKSFGFELSNETNNYKGLDYQPMIYNK